MEDAIDGLLPAITAPCHSTLVQPLGVGRLSEVRSEELHIRGPHALDTWVPCFSAACVAFGMVDTKHRWVDSHRPKRHHMRNQAVGGDQSSAASRVLALDLEVLVAMVLWEVVLVAMVQLLAQWLME